MWYRKWGKRVFDLVLTLPSLVVLSPVMLIVAILVWRKHGAPILYEQKRPGLNGTIFTLRKFRTMTNERDADGNLLPDEQRLTRFGAFLRRSSLDELPELWNVLKGEMSLVGPRPLLVKYLPLYNAHQARRHETLPGITGWAQVNGRNALGWDEKFNYDVWYVDNMSLWLDVRILWRTVGKVIKREGIGQTSDQTHMSEFTGNPPSTA